jgi:hypothetical protein
MGQDRWASRAPTDPQEVARWVRTRRRSWRDHVDRVGQDRWASLAPTDPQEDRLKDGERAVCQRQKRTDTDIQQARVLKEKKKKTIFASKFSYYIDTTVFESAYSLNITEHQFQVRNATLP